MYFCSEKIKEMYNNSQLTEDKKREMIYHYYKFTDNLVIYRKNMRMKSYRYKYSENEMEVHSSQYRSMKSLLAKLAENLLVIDPDIAVYKHMIFNRFLPFKLRFVAIKKYYFRAFGFADYI